MSVNDVKPTIETSSPASKAVSQAAKGTIRFQMNASKLNAFNKLWDGKGARVSMTTDEVLYTDVLKVTLTYK